MYGIRGAALTIIIALIIIFQPNAQDSLKGKLAVLPLQATGIDQNYARTAESIFQVEIANRTALDLIPVKLIKEQMKQDSCIDMDCAAAFGRKLGAFSIAGCSISALGTKVIVQYFLVNVNNSKIILHDQVTSNTIEDLEVVMKRVAKSIVERESFTKNVEVGTITAAEADKQARRSSVTNRGLSFGYLYPSNGYDNDERSFVLDGRLGYELQDYAVGMLLGIRKGFAVNLYGQWLLTKQDVCPYVGASFGFHWITHETYVYSPTPPGYGSYIEQKDKRADGFEIGLSTGLRLFRTYNFQLFINVEYIVTMNDYEDQAIVFTLGLL